MDQADEELPKLQVLLDSKGISRCSWCGTLKSKKWITNQLGLFCSEDCIRAYNYQQYSVYHSSFFSIVIIAILASIYIVVYSLISETYKPSVAFFGIILTSSVVICCFWIRPSDRYTKEVPRNSRWNVGIIDVSLLKRVSSPIKCPNCDANLDLSEIKKDLIYHCKYCGASGIIEIVTMKQ